MKINKFIVLLTFLSAFLIFSGCKKSKQSPFTKEFQNVMLQNALAEAFVDDVLKISENILMTNGNARIETTAAPLGCITNIDTVVTGATTKRYTISYDSTCTSYDGKKRQGTVIVDLEGANYNTTGSSLTIRFSNFYINGNLFVGKISSTNMGAGVFIVVVSDETGTDYATLTIAGLGNLNSKWKASYKKTIFSGDADQVILNNKYYISSYNASINMFEGITTDGKNYYSTTTITDLLLDNSCTAYGNLRYPSSGSIKYHMDGDSRDVDYGNGTCDISVTMSVAGTSQAFNLY